MGGAFHRYHTLKCALENEKQAQTFKWTDSLPLNLYVSTILEIFHHEHAGFLTSSIGTLKRVLLKVHCIPTYQDSAPIKSILAL